MGFLIPALLALRNNPFFKNEKSFICLLSCVAIGIFIIFAGMTPAIAVVNEVWVDDDWAGSIPGGIVDGHEFGTDAFATRQLPNANQERTLNRVLVISATFIVRTSVNR